MDRAIRRRLLPRDLRRLNDVLSTTSLAGRYWVWGGVLLGWARDGRLLADDMMDVDFLLLAEDEPHLLDAVPALEEAGFSRRFRYRNNRGTVTEYTFARHEASFDFFLFFPDAQPGMRRYFSYYYPPDDPVELEGVLAEQPLEQFRFLDRSWSKPKDHEAVLDAIYGDWKHPRSDWSALDDGALVDRRPWKVTAYGWE